MKIPRKYLPVILFVCIACLLTIAAVVLLRTPVVQNDWSGVRPINTTTPTATIFPVRDLKWLTAMPTAPGLQGIPIPGTPTPTPTLALRTTEGPTATNQP